MKSLASPQPIKFSSSDTEGSDFSYNSSFDEKNEKDQNEIAKNVQLLKDQMNHFFLTHPEFKKNMEFEDFDYLEDIQEKKKDLIKNKKTLETNGLLNEKGKSEISSDKKNQKKEKSEKNNNYASYWGQLADNILKESKKNLGPSVEYINHRLNLFRMNSEKPTVHEVLLAESKLTNNFQTSKKSKSLTNEEKLKKEIHEKAKAKLREETGDVQYFSYKKKIQFQFRINKEEKKLEEERKEKEKLNKNYSPTKGNNQTKTESPDSQKKEKAPTVFEKLYLNRKQNNLQNLLEMEEPLDKDLKTTAGAELYRKLKKCEDEDSIKRVALQSLNEYKAKAEENFDLKNSLLNHIPRFYGDESKEFNIFFPDFSLAKGMTQKQIDAIFERPEKYENLDGNVFLLKKMKKIMNGNIIKYWKHLQDSQKT